MAAPMVAGRCPGGVPVVLLEGAAALAEMSGEVAGWTPGSGKAVPALAARAARVELPGAVTTPVAGIR
ncbi:hypothetical protein ABGB16_26885 [Micromonospora sp. B11E3]|uniref:hypothetical protein n=1 Tax=Micromonospora sp. B11E3 TaxID=3153562 RepID=UPI00325D4B2F